ncbi:MAG: tetratricopeptide repeat protein [Methanobacteriota archaeon]
MNHLYVLIFLIGALLLVAVPCTGIGESSTEWYTTENTVSDTGNDSGILEPDLGYEDMEAFVDDGYAQLEIEMYEDALDEFDAALDIDPEYADAWYFRGVALYYLGPVTK